jgi:hypothetical protein
VKFSTIAVDTLKPNRQQSSPWGYAQDFYVKHAKHEREQTDTCSFEATNKIAYKLNVAGDLLNNWQCALLIILKISSVSAKAVFKTNTRNYS